MANANPNNSTKFGKGNPGKPKGAVNKLTKELKEMILEALDNAGGVDYLTERAQDPKTASAFITLIGKTLPMTVRGPNEDGSHSVSVNVNFVGGRKPS